MLLSLLCSAVNDNGSYKPGARVGLWSVLELGGEMAAWAPCLALQDLGQCQVTLGGYATWGLLDIMASSTGMAAIAPNPTLLCATWLVLLWTH